MPLELPLIMNKQKYYSLVIVYKFLDLKNASKIKCTTSSTFHFRDYFDHVINWVVSDLL